MLAGGVIPSFNTGSVMASNMLVVKCKSCQRVLLPVRDKMRCVRGVNYMRWQYQCENVMCDAIGETQHRSAPQKVEMVEVQQ